MSKLRLKSALPLVVAAAWTALSMTSCATEDARGAGGPIGSMIETAARDHDVPRDLVLALADVEGGLRLRATREVDPDDHVPVAGVLELRHGGFDSLARGAALSGVDATELQRDLAKGTEAGALVLRDLGRELGASNDRLDSWAPVVEKLSGLRRPSERAEYRARVFARLRAGGTLRARGGETIELPAHPELPAELAFSPPDLHPLGGPDYAPAIYFPTDCTNKCNSTRTASITMIAIHDTEGGWDASVATLENDPGKSVHYIVDHDGSRVGQFIPESYDGWHVGNSYYNNRMVGIEHVGYASEDDYRTAMYETSAALVKDIAARHGIPLDRKHIVAHQEVPNGNAIPESSAPCPDSPGSCVKDDDYGGASNHRDPGVNWEWCQYMELVGGTCKCNDTFDLWNCVHDLSMMNRCVDGQVEIQHCEAPCVVEPIGTNDHCGDPPATDGAGGATASSATTGSGVVTPIQTGEGGAGGGADGEIDNDIHGSCTCTAAGPGDGSYALALAGAAFAAGMMRRRRRAIA
jgi:MYXO-CTERM domain-containing protein